MHLQWFLIVHCYRDISNKYQTISTFSSSSTLGKNERWHKITHAFAPTMMSIKDMGLL